MQLTLDDLKKRPLNKDMYDSMYETFLSEISRGLYNRLTNQEN